MPPGLYLALGLVALAGAIALPTGLLLRLRRQRIAMFRAAVGAVGASLESVDGDRVRAKAGDVELSFEVYMGTTESRARTYATADVPAPFAVSFTLCPHTFGEPDGGALTIGDADLDSSWRITGSPAARVVRVLEDATVQRRLREVAVLHDTRVVVKGRRVEVSRDDVNAVDEALVTARLALVLALVLALARAAGSGEAEPAEASSAC